MHCGIPESRTELLPSGTAMLVEHFYTLRHLHQQHDQIRGRTRGRDQQIYFGTVGASEYMSRSCITCQYIGPSCVMYNVPNVLALVREGS